MIQLLRVLPELVPSCRTPSLALESLHRRACGLKPGLPESSAEFDGAIVLLAGLELGQNTHRLALFTRLDARFVARCARHLIDNGVWQQGGTLCGWSDVKDGVDAFWADVQVALGHACRRLDDVGALCWAPAGQWWKPFEDREVGLDGSHVDYRIPELTPLEEAEAVALEPSASENAAPAVLRPGIEFEGISPRAVRRFAEWSEEEPIGMAARKWRDEVASNAFPDAVWLA